MQFEEALNLLKVEENHELNSKLKRIKEVELELEKYLNKINIKRDERNHLNHNKKLLEDENTKKEILLVEKRILVNNCYFEIEAKVKKLNELIENIKKEAFFLKTQNFNMKSKAIENSGLEELINKSK
jgi:hypothetical protein